ncbi:hypothetical protein GGR56DRAFT_698381 [Xylariaceae sp. FL0804]|nr:hypothetical protein GGR56DRAFT_698381 [Xylariaceae sp. FL0804]
MLFNSRASVELPEGVDPCSIPAGVSPDGSPPNFVDPPSLQPAIIAISAVLLPIAITICAGRLFVNRKSLRLADYFMLVGLVFDIGITGVLLAMSRGYRHIWDTPVCWLDARYLKLTFVEVLVVGPAVFFPKAAIFLFYLQLFSIKKTVRIGSKVGLVVAFLAYFPTSLILCYFDAPHVGQTWNSLLTSALPGRGIAGGVTIGAASVLVDIYVFILPLPTIFTLNIAFSKRLQLVALFMTALTGIVASVVCLVYRVKLLGLTDSGWQSGAVAIAIVVENNVAIIVGSLPSFTTFVRIYIADTQFYKSLQSRISSRNKSNATGDFQSDGWRNRTEWTYGSPRKEQKKDYHELSDSMILRSNIAVPQLPPPSKGASGTGILRTVEFSQEQYMRQSSERLV